MFKKMLSNPTLLWWLIKQKISKVNEPDDEAYVWWLDSGMPFISQKELETELFDVDERS